MNFKVAHKIENYSFTNITNKSNLNGLITQTKDYIDNSKIMSIEVKFLNLYYTMDPNSSKLPNPQNFLIYKEYCFIFTKFTDTELVERTRETKIRQQNLKTTWTKFLLMLLNLIQIKVDIWKNYYSSFKL